VRLLAKILAPILLQCAAANAETITPPSDEADAPVIEFMILKVAAPRDEVDATLALKSTGGAQPSFLLPAAHGESESLLESLSTLQPQVLASQSTRPTKESSTALDLYLGKTGITLRTKSVGIRADRYKFWLGVQKSKTGNGPPTITDRTSTPVEIAFGEALVTSVGHGLLIVATPDAFEPGPPQDEVSAPPVDASIELDSQNTLSETADEPRIEWDAVPGADVPDADALRRILGD